MPVNPSCYPERWKGREIRSTTQRVREAEEFALELRRRSTTGERILWEALRGRKPEGNKFRRQHPFGPFIVDFYCIEKRLAIEVDGPIHDKQALKDRERQMLIEATGCKVLRFTNTQVEQDLKAVIETIREWLNAST